MVFRAEYNLLRVAIVVAIFELWNLKPEISVCRDHSAHIVVASSDICYRYVCAVLCGPCSQSARLNDSPDFVVVSAANFSFSIRNQVATQIKREAVVFGDKLELKVATGGYFYTVSEIEAQPVPTACI